MLAFSRVLQGLSYPAQLLSTATEVDGSATGWVSPPRVERTWAFVADEGLTTMQSALTGMGFDVADAGRARSPESFAFDRDKPAIYRDHVRLASGEVAASFVLRRWPRLVAAGWLGHALARLKFPVSVGVHIRPDDPIRVGRFLRKQQAWQTDTGPVKSAANTLGAKDAQRMQTDLVARTDRPCKVAVVLTVRAPDLATLQQRMRDTAGEMALTLSDFRDARGEQDRAFLATQQTGTCDVNGSWKTLDCTSVASTWIFQPVTLLHRHGARLGVTHESNMLVQLDPFDETLRSFSGLLTGSVGSGKSYFLKLLLRHLPDKVEKRIVEHSDPPEYAGVPGVLTFNIAEMDEESQVEALREYIGDLWLLARRDPRPRLLVLDELWSMLLQPELRKLVAEIARRGRKYGLALWIATQQVEELIESGKSVFDNAAIKVYLQQEDRDLKNLAHAANLSQAGRVTLRTAARGQALIQCRKMIVLVDVQATPQEHELISTDPRELWGIDDEDEEEQDADDAGFDPDDDDADAGTEVGPAGHGLAGAGLHRRGRAGGRPAVVGA